MVTKKFWHLSPAAMAAAIFLMPCLPSIAAADQADSCEIITRVIEAEQVIHPLPDEFALEAIHIEPMPEGSRIRFDPSTAAPLPPMNELSEFNAWRSTEIALAAARIQTETALGADSFSGKAAQRAEFLEQLAAFTAEIEQPGHWPTEPPEIDRALHEQLYAAAPLILTCDFQTLGAVIGIVNPETGGVMVGSGPTSPASLTFGHWQGARLSLSQIGYSADGERALIRTSYSCGALCGHGTLYLLERDSNGAWQTIGSAPLFIA